MLCCLAYCKYIYIYITTTNIYIYVRFNTTTLHGEQISIIPFAGTMPLAGGISLPLVPPSACYKHGYTCSCVSCVGTQAYHLAQHMHMRGKEYLTATFGTSILAAERNAPLCHLLLNFYAPSIHEWLHQDRWLQDHIMAEKYSGY